MMSQSDRVNAAEVGRGGGSVGGMRKKESAKHTHYVQRKIKLNSQKRKCEAHTSSSNRKQKNI